MLRKLEISEVFLYLIFSFSFRWRDVLTSSIQLMNQVFVQEFVKPIHEFFSREEQRDRIILMHKAHTYRPGIRPAVMPNAFCCCCCCCFTSKEVVKKSFLLSKILNDKQVCHFETEICFVRDFLLKRKQITDLTGRV